MTTTTIKGFHELSIVGGKGLPMVYANNDNTGERITIPVHAITALQENPPDESQDWRPDNSTNYLVLHTHAGIFYLQPARDYGDVEWVDEVGVVWDLFTGRSFWNGREAQRNTTNHHPATDKERP